MRTEYILNYVDRDVTLETLSNRRNINVSLV